MSSLDALELDLRRLPHVAYVGMLPRDGTMIVQLVVLGSPDPAEVRLRAEQLCRVHLDVPFAVEIAGGGRPARVQVVGVEVTGTPDDPRLKVELAFEGQRTTGEAPTADPTGAARATFEALKNLGAAVPFDIQAAALFQHELGEGVMVILGSPDAGGRYGVAAGPTVEQAAVRATLHALNRYLAAQTLPA